MTTDPIVKTTDATKIAGFLPNLQMSGNMCYKIFFTNLSVTQPPTKENMKAKATVMLVIRESQRVASSGFCDTLYLSFSLFLSDQWEPEALCAVETSSVSSFT